MLKEKLIKLAQNNPDLRKHLIPILKEATIPNYGFWTQDKGNKISLYAEIFYTRNKEDVLDLQQLKSMINKELKRRAENIKINIGWTYYTTDWITNLNTKTMEMRAVFTTQPLNPEQPSKKEILKFMQDGRWPR